MNKSIILLIVLSLCAAVSVECATRRSIRAASTTGNATQLMNGKTVKFSTQCQDIEGTYVCPDNYFYVEIPSVTFLPSSRSVEFLMALANVTCANLDGEPVGCPEFNKTSGLRLVVTNPNNSPILNFTVPQLTNTLSNQHTAKNVQINQQYLVTISQPLIEEPDVVLTSYSGKVKTIYADSMPAWVIVVLVAGGLLALVLIVVIVYCLHKKCTHKKDGYESFD